MTAKKAVWILNRIQGFGVQTFKRLQSELGDVAKLGDPTALDQLRGKSEWGAGFANRYLELETAGDFEREMDRCAKEGIEILSILDSDYPKNLASVYDPPLVLYVKGTLIPEDNLAVAIVGSRNPSLYGLRTAARFSLELAERGFTVVSGFARGIDGEAHQSALRAKGRTIAVLGCGLDVLYPKEHGQLYEQIAAQGALLSELPLGTPPQSFHFPRRNRLISGLVAGVLVVEAGRRSGSLITARLAAEEGREVYAVPGLIDSPTSAGTNQLIQEGAKLVTGVSDILEDLAPQLQASLASIIGRSVLPQDDAVNDPVLKLLENRSLSFDEIALGLSEHPNRVRSRLTELELQGAVRRMFGGRYARRSSV